MSAPNALTVPMPDGSTAGSRSEAAQRLCVTEATILRHLRKYGHLRNIAPNRSVVATSTKGAKRGGGGAVLARGITLDRAVFEAGKDVDFRHAETTPAGRNHMVGARVIRRPDTRIDTVIETIRACRDEYLREKQP